MSRRYYCDEHVPGATIVEVTQRPVTCREQYLLAIEACYNFKVVRPFPLKIMVESSNRCMLRCAMCPRDRMTRPEGDLSPYPLMMKGATLRGIFVGAREHFEGLMRAADVNELHPVIDRVFDFDSAPDAFAYMKSAQHFGKLVITL